MAYINAKEVKQIREELKKQYPDIKWSVSKEDSINVNVCMLEGNIDFSDIETTGLF
jgi:membrane-bound lytic murein transglycosylase MltF